MFSSVETKWHVQDTGQYYRSKQIWIMAHWQTMWLACVKTWVPSLALQKKTKLNSKLKNKLHFSPSASVFLSENWNYYCGRYFIEILYSTYFRKLVSRPMLMHLLMSLDENDHSTKHLCNWRNCFLMNKLAMAYLIRGNELELAVSVGTVLGAPASPATHYALQLLARKCMMIPMW